MEIMKINLISHCHIIINLKWITCLNVKGITTELLGKKKKNMREYLCDLGIGKDFLARIQT